MYYVLRMLLVVLAMWLIYLLRTGIWGWQLALDLLLLCTYTTIVIRVLMTHTTDKGDPP